MSEFVTMKDAWIAGSRSTGEDLDQEGSPGLGFNLFDTLGKVGTQWLNNVVPGLGPVVNPGFYKDQQKAQQQQQAAAQQQQRMQQMTQPGYAGGIAPSGVPPRPGLPSWVIPVSIAGGAVLVAVVLAVALSGRRRNPVRYKSARGLARAFGTSGYYTDERGLVGVDGRGGVIWFRWDPDRGSYRMTGTTSGAKGADYRKVA